MTSSVRFLVATASLATLSLSWLPSKGVAHGLAKRDPMLQVVNFRGLTDPEGKPLAEETQIECRVYDPNKPEATGTIAHTIGVAGAAEFEVSILNNQYTQASLKGCRCSIEIHGKGETNWDVTPYIAFKFFDGSSAGCGFGKIKLGTGEGYKTKFDLAIPTL